MKIFKINDFFEKSHICLIVWNSEPEWKGDEYPETYSESNQCSKPFRIIEKDGLTGVWLCSENVSGTSTILFRIKFAVKATGLLSYFS